MENSATYVKRILKSHNLSPTKSLGQNFLINDSAIKAIGAMPEITQEDVIVEIGPGIGCLTRELVKLNPYHLILIEKDKLFENAINSIVEDSKEPDRQGRASIHFTDALGVNWRTLLRDFISEGRKIKLVANLPYNVGTSIVMQIALDYHDIFSSVHVMLQKEVVNRITAVPRTKDYGRVSVIIQSLYKVKKCLTISNESFIPKPKIYSSVVGMHQKTKEELDAEYGTIRNLDLLSKLTKALFQNRRKKLKPALQNFLAQQSTTSINFDSHFKDIAPKRAEELSVAEFQDIVKVIIAHQKKAS